MIQLTGVQRVLDSTKNRHPESGYKMTEKDESFRQDLKAAHERKHEQTPQQCEQEIMGLFQELNQGCKRIRLLVHPNVYVEMADNELYGKRIKERLCNCFLESSMSYPAITLARLGVGEVYIRIAYNGDLSYSSTK